VRETLHKLVHYATLAPNSHNTQPWKFSIENTSICLFPNYSRRLPVNDPNDREFFISLGCALENLLIASRSLGYKSEVVYLPKGEEECLRINLTPSARKLEEPLFAAIPIRQSTRNQYNKQTVPVNVLRRLEGLSLPQGISTCILTADNQIRTLVEYVVEGDKQQYGNQAFVDELIYWIRFNKGEAFKTLDGMYAPCAGNPSVPRWLGKHFVTTKTGKQQSDKDAKQICSSARVLVVLSETDDKTAWLDTGRACERLMLTMTSLNLKSAFVNQPIQVSTLRTQLISSLNLGNLRPQVMLRFGYGKEMPRSMRRPVEQVLI